MGSGRDAGLDTGDGFLQTASIGTEILYPSVGGKSQRVLAGLFQDQGQPVDGPEVPGVQLKCRFDIPDGGREIAPQVVESGSQIPGFREIRLSLQGPVDQTQCRAIIAPVRIGAGKSIEGIDHWRTRRGPEPENLALDPYRLFGSAGLQPVKKGINPAGLSRGRTGRGKCAGQQHGTGP